MQSRGIMHRDLKPQNIMLDENYNIKVVSEDQYDQYFLSLLKQPNNLSELIQIDFGDAKKENEPPLEDEVPEQQPTNDENPSSEFAADMMSMHTEGGMDRRGTLVGTMNYLAPEMIQSQQASIATDLWALGCIIFKMVTGQVPFTGTQNYTVFPKINNREIEWPTQQ